MNAKKARKVLRAAQHIAKKAESREFVESGRSAKMMNIARDVAAAAAMRLAMPFMTTKEWMKFKNVHSSEG